jgi:hypothetical protein
MIVAKAEITADAKDDVWLLWNTAKVQPALKAKIKADGFTLSKDNFDGHRWKIVWFYTVDENSYDEVEDDNTGETIYMWQKQLNDLTHKWIVRLAQMKDVLLASDNENSVEDPYPEAAEVEDDLDE